MLKHIGWSPMDQEIQGLCLVRETNLPHKPLTADAIRPVHHAPMPLCYYETPPLLMLDGSLQSCRVTGIATATSHSLPLSCQPAQQGGRALIKTDLNFTQYNTTIKKWGFPGR